MEPEFTESDSHDGVANLISVLRICEQIETSKETIKKNSDQGECNDCIIVTYSFNFFSWYNLLLTNKKIEI